MMNDINKKMMIDEIERVITDLDNSWVKSIKKDIIEIEESWQDSAREEYIAKLESVSSIVNKLTSELKQLEIIWEKYNDNKDIIQ